MLGKGKIRNTYTDSKYAYLVLHAHATLQKETGLLNAKHSPVKDGTETLSLIKAGVIF